MKNYYEILGVGTKAEKEEIKAAFKKLAVKYHPDKNPDNPASEEYFKEVNAAYQTLSDTDARWRYDQSLLEGTQIPVFTATSAKAKPATSPHQRRTATHGFRKSPKKPYYDKSKEQKMGFIWTISLIVIIAIPMSIHSYFEKKAEEALKARAVVLYNEAKQLIEKKEYRLGFDALENDTLRTLGDALQLENQLFQMLKNDALTTYQEKNFSKSLEVHLLILFFTKDTINNEDFYLRIAMCYAGIGNLAKAENILSELERARPAYKIDLAITLCRARIYTQVGKLEKAKKIYDLTADTIIAHYIRDYGKLYYLSKNPTLLHEEDYSIFYEKGMLDTQLKNYQIAEKSLDWAIRIRPKYSQTYYQKGVLFFQQNKKEKAYKLWKQAKELGSKDAWEMLLKYKK